MSKRRALRSFVSASSGDDTSLRTKALVTGSVALGAYLTGALVRRARRAALYETDDLPPALEATVQEQELMEGCARFYERPGIGVPLVLLHSFNAAASSYEMLPLFNHLTATTTRPVFALEWFGFGLSDRPPVRYRPAIYQRQLRRFLSERLNEPADLIALSLGGAYAAVLTAEAPFLVRKLVLLCPTGLSQDHGASLVQRALLGLADSTGAFELFFYRLTRRDALRRFYARQVFLEGAEVPHNLVNYAFLTAHVHGAHYAPRRFIDGTLFLGPQAQHAYTHLQRPTLMIAPERDEGLIQSFALLDDIVAGNDTFLQAHRVPAGLLPQWEAPEALFEKLDAFLA